MTLNKMMAAVGLWAMAAVAVQAAEPPTAPVKLNIAAQPLGDALNEFGRQAGLQVVLFSALGEGMKAPRLMGSYKPDEALKKLLEDSGLRFEYLNERTVAVKAAKIGADTAQAGEVRFAQSANSETMRKVDSASEPRKSSARESSSASEDEDRDSRGIPEILVTGRHTLNTDIRRTEDDAQPYVVFSGDEIRASGALNLEEFFRQRLPMNAVSSNQSGGSMQQNSSIVSGGINLRGLGTNQTLILVDGRRLPSVSTGDDYAQPNINGILPAAIERIEILPATASGIYGGSATGGAINIIMKRDFTGFDVQAVYGNTFDSDVGSTRFSLTGGFSLENGRTKVMIGAGHSRQNELMPVDRDFSRQAFDVLTRNYPTYSSLYTLANGPTPNVISSTGANLVLDEAYGGTALNSPWTFVPADYAGPGSDNAQRLVGNAGHLNVTGSPLTLSTAPMSDYASLNIRRELTGRLDAYLDLYRDRSGSTFTSPQYATVTIAAASPDNPFQQDIRVNLPLYRDDFAPKTSREAQMRRVNAGLIARLPLRWSATLDYGWSQSKTPVYAEYNSGPTSAGNAVLQAAALTDLSAFPIADVESLFNVGKQDSSAVNGLQTLSLRLSGPLLDLPGGALTLSGLAEQRREHNDDDFLRVVTAPAAPVFYWTPRAEQKVQSAYLELRAPIFAAANALPLVHELELTASSRRDEYKTHWAASSVAVTSPDEPLPPQTYVNTQLKSTDYTLGLRYAPVQDLALRVSLGTGFLPPSLSRVKSDFTLYPASSIPYADSQRNGELLTGDPDTGLVRYISGGNPAIRPEQSESLSYGFIFTPRFLEGLRLSVDMTRIRKSDEIFIPYAGLILDNQTSYPGRLTRAPLTQADIDAGYSAGPITAIDVSALNLFHSDVRAIDFQLDYTRAIGASGEWHFYLVGTRQDSLERQTSPTLPPTDSTGYSNGPLEWRGNAGLDWSAGPWAAGWNAQYFSGYSLCSSTQTPASCAASASTLAQGTDAVPDQLYHDAFVRYRFPAAATVPMLAGSEISFGIQNLFDKSPPILALIRYSSFGDPRLRRFTLTLSKHFGG